MIQFVPCYLLVLGLAWKRSGKDFKTFFNMGLSRPRFGFLFIFLKHRLQLIDTMLTDGDRKQERREE